MSIFTSEENDRISRAIAEAESSTGGEIVTAIIPESDDYAFRELLFAVMVGSLVFIAVSLFAPFFQSVLDRLFWVEGAAFLPMTLGLIAFAAGNIAYILVQIPAIDRMVIGKALMAEAVRRRALRHFMESGCSETVDRTGVLLFISILERRVELVADKGINDVVAPDTWDRIVSSLVRGIRDNKTADAVSTAVREIGAVLAEHVPPRKDDENELADGPTELGKGS
jgi:putative membrane protein